MKSRKVTVEQLYDAFQDLINAKNNIIEAKKWERDAQELFDKLSKRASGQTSKKFLESFCTEDIYSK